MSTATALIVSSLISATASGVTASVQHDTAKEAEWDQKQAQKKAEATQKAADEKAEMQRLQGLKAQSTATTYGDVWGTDSKKYADAAQKLSAGTGSFNTDDEENNPFYTRGLL